MDDSHGGRTLDLHVPAQAASLARVRRLLIGFLAEHHVDEDQWHNALLVTNELAANAIEHGSRDSDEIEISITRGTQSLLIRVLDPARTDATPVPLEPDEVRESGRGMLIVGKLATWREQLNEGRREVTARLPLSC
jgi:anti-sigma regulatory factor (Ser/Thr protein kinase)